MVTQITVTLSIELAVWIHEEAKREGLSKSAWIKRLLTSAKDEIEKGRSAPDGFAELTSEDTQ